MNLGELTAGDLGSIVTVTKGGATYTGSLCTVHHDDYGSGLRTLVTLKAEGWRHCEVYPSETPCEVKRQCDGSCGDETPHDIHTEPLGL